MSGEWDRILELAEQARYHARQAEKWGRVALYLGALSMSAAVVSLICMVIGSMWPTLSLWALVPICVAVLTLAWHVVKRFDR